jgi:hypothetical protein
MDGANYAGYIIAAVVIVIVMIIIYKISNNPLITATAAIGSLGKTDGIARTAGVPVHACPPGTEKDPSGLLCYPSCRSLPAAAADIAANPSIDFNAVGPACWTKCPDGYTDFGVGCSKPAAYGRGVGTPLTVTCPAGWNVRGVGTASWCDIWDPFLRTQSASWTCKPGEERNGELCYPKCKPGFHNVGCCTCGPDCPPGTVDSGVSCTKKNFSRGGGVPMVCGAGEELSGALCYPKCDTVPAVMAAMKETGKTFRGDGPVCWQIK